MTKMWMIRAGRDSIYVDDFLQKEIVAIGWLELGQVDAEISKSKLTELYRATYPKDSDGRVNTVIGQIVRFLKEVKSGDQVVTYDRDKRQYYVGSITSNAKWKPELLEGMPRIRTGHLVTAHLT